MSAFLHVWSMKLASQISSSSKSHHRVPPFSEDEIVVPEKRHRPRDLWEKDPWGSWGRWRQQIRHLDRISPEADLLSWLIKQVPPSDERGRVSVKLWKRSMCQVQRIIALCTRKIDATTLLCSSRQDINTLSSHASLWDTNPSTH